MPKSWHLRRSQPGRQKKAWDSTFYILKFQAVSLKQHLCRDFKHVHTAESMHTGSLGHAQIHSASTFRVLDSKLLSCSPLCRTINRLVSFPLPLLLQITDLYYFGNVCNLLSTLICHSSNEGRTVIGIDTLKCQKALKNKAVLEYISSDALGEKETMPHSHWKITCINAFTQFGIQTLY